MYSDRYTTYRGGFPHSEIHGSKSIGLSPWLIAAYHVLHRLLVPRHPQNALMRLIRTQLIISVQLFIISHQNKEDFFLMTFWDNLQSELFYQYSHQCSVLSIQYSDNS